MSQINKVVQNNRKLLRKKNRFKKERTFLRIDVSNAKWKKREIKFKEASQALLSQIKLEHKYENRKRQLINAIILFGLLGFSIFIMTQAYKDDQQYAAKVIPIEVNETQRAYLKYIRKGDGWFKEGKFKASIFYYNKAKILYPKDFDVNFRILRSLSLQCEFQNEFCSETEALLDEMSEAFTNRTKEFIEIKKNIKIGRSL